MIKAIEWTFSFAFANFNFCRPISPYTSSTYSFNFSICEVEELFPERRSRKWLVFLDFRRTIFLRVSIKIYFTMHTAVIAEQLPFVSVAFYIITHVSSGTRNGGTSFPFKSTSSKDIQYENYIVKQIQNFTVWRLYTRGRLTQYMPTEKR